MDTSVALPITPEIVCDLTSTTDHRAETCECLHDPDRYDTQDWENGWPCGDPATHLLVVQCDCGHGCPDWELAMCRSCMETAVEYGFVRSVRAL